MLVRNVLEPVDYGRGVFPLVISDVLFLTSVLILWSICLLIRPISLLAGLISLQVGLLAKFSF